jgi:tRNA (cmo5U34)-methyltransferase
MGFVSSNGVEMSFSDPTSVAQYVENLIRQVPAVRALHQMANVLLAEHVAPEGRVLVLGAGGGMELKAFADAHPGWSFVGIDPSAEMLALAVRTLGDGASPRIELIQGYVQSAPELEFDGATCLLTLHFLSREERLRTLVELRRRLRPGAPLVIAHHSVPSDLTEKRTWFRRWAAFSAANGLPDANADARAEMIADRLPTLAPEAEEALLHQAGFKRPSLFYVALTFRGWVAYA